MAFKLAEAFVDIRANDSTLDSGLAKARQKLGRFFDSVKEMAVPIAGIIGSVVVAKFTQYIGDAAKSAGDLNETLSMTEVVFGNATATVLKFADEMNDKFGSVRTEILGAAADFGITAKAIGLNKVEAAAFSTQLVKLADDAASFRNVTLADALERIKAALRGEADPIEKLGVQMKESAVNAEVLRLGLAKTASGITETMKVQARYSLIAKGLADATGDHARTQKQFNGQLKEFTDRLNTLSASIGQLFLPTFNKMLQAINPVLQGIERMISRLQEMPSIANGVTSALSGIFLGGAGASFVGGFGAGGKAPAAAQAKPAGPDLPDDPFKAAAVRTAAEAAAKKAAGDVSFFKAAGLSSMLLNVKGADGKATQQVNPVFQEVVDNARLKTEGMMSSLKDKAGTAAALLDQDRRAHV